ncbi:PIG-P-domain-containing protein [Lentinula raphanica]|nr:PIG-P-domain-containing protein [Lentinula raphanica]
MHRRLHKNSKSSSNSHCWHLDASMTSLDEPVAPAPSEYHFQTPELHGLIAWTSSSFLFLVYILWALLPDECIVGAGVEGVEWYPNREWSLLIPAWSMVMVLLTYFAYMALTIHCTPAFHDISAVTGGYSGVCNKKTSNKGSNVDALPSKIPKPNSPSKMTQVRLESLLFKLRPVYSEREKHKAGAI